MSANDDGSNGDEAKAQHLARLSELVERGHGMQPDDLASYLHEECGNDDGLLRAVKSCLGDLAATSDQTKPDNLHDIVGRAAADLMPTKGKPPRESGSGDWIGRYRLLEKIGTGGMGDVWLAEQTSPVKRRVAVKLIKTGLDSDRVIARFEVERQALAMMDHPYVAKVLDAGATAEGKPYFVMELVEGTSITEHCDRQRLTTVERIELMRQVCEGVQHAHHKGVIHRDLKPTNVLVTMVDGRPVPKIIDFGVAKSVAQKLTERTLHTELGTPMGTPEYMSPEQVSPNLAGIDTRTDVYSLGVLLYELLVGALPHDRAKLLRGGWESFFQQLRETDPPVPSARISTLGDKADEFAIRRRVDARTLRRQLHGELDWIVMLALDKDRERRYASPAEFAADLQRYLDDKPVAAGPPSSTYRAIKYVRRHRLAVAASVAALLVLIAFAGTMTVQRSRIAVEHEKAQRDRAAAERVAAFLADGLGKISPQGLGRAMWREQRDRVADGARARKASEKETAAEVDQWERVIASVNMTSVARAVLESQILSHFSDELKSTFGDDPEVAARLEITLAESFLKMGNLPIAEGHARRSAELRRQALGPTDRDTLAAQVFLAGTLLYQGRLDESEELLRTTMAIQARVLGPEDEDTLSSATGLDFIRLQRGQLDEAEAGLRTTLATQERVLGRDHMETMFTLGILSSVLGKQKRHVESEAIDRRILNTTRRVHPNEVTTIMNASGNLATVLAENGKTEESEKLQRETLALRRRVLGDEHETTFHTWKQLAFGMYSRGNLAEAEDEFSEILVKSSRALGSRHHRTIEAQSALVSIYLDTGRFPEALELSGKVFAITRELGPTSESHVGAMRLRGLVLRDAGRLAEATPLLVEAYTKMRELHPPEEPRPAYRAHALTLPAVDLAGLYAATGELNRCFELLHELVVTHRMPLGRLATQRIFAPLREAPRFRPIFDALERNLAEN